MGLMAMGERRSLPAGKSMTIRAVAVYWRGCTALTPPAIETAVAQLTAIERHRNCK
jgi:hypothetical protein